MDPRHLLRLLSIEQPMSGTAIAQKLGVSRAAVWKQIEVLRSFGAVVTAAPGKGYRLAAPFELLDRDAILAELPSALRRQAPALEIHWRVDSTNSALLRMTAQGAPDGMVYLAETQSAGRGRRGRTWISPLAGNIYFSLLKRFECGIGALVGLSLAAGVALQRALMDCGVGGTGLKWPNDVLAGERKLAGILIELGGDFLGPCFAVVGIGVNLHLDGDNAAALDRPSTDLAGLCAGQPPSRNRLIGKLWMHLLAVFDVFSQQGFAPLMTEYSRYDLLAGRTVRVSLADGDREGVAVGVDARGALKVRHGVRLISYDSADVSVLGL